MSKKSSDGLATGKFVSIGYLSLALLVFGIGAWGASTRISGAIVAAGSVEVEGNRQIVQHPIGGVIAAIHVRDGDMVEEDQVLVVLDGQTLETELDIVEGQWFEILARKSRLSAERDGFEEIAFDPELVLQAKTHPEMMALMDAQVNQFEAGQELLEKESNQLEERQTQIANQIEGLVSLRAATQSQIGLLNEELEGQESLLKQGLTQVARVLALRRELASLEGTFGQADASVAENRGRIAEIEIERVRLVSQKRQDATAELRDLEFREIELRERRRSLLDQISKLELRAPAAGVIYGSTADTVRGVIQPAEPVMYVVPNNSVLIARTQIETIHIDQVHIGQAANLRFSAFDMRTTPEVPGVVSAVSADAIEDPERGFRYYRADIELDPDMLASLGEITVLPGMPVEAYIKTGERSPLSFFTKPLMDYFNRAFREG